MRQRKFNLTHKPLASPVLSEALAQAVERRNRALGKILLRDFKGPTPRSGPLPSPGITPEGFAIWDTWKH